MPSTLLTLDEKDVNSSIDISNRSNYYARVAVRAVLRDSDGRVALMYARQRQYYKLPGGGVDEGEELDDALQREILEETGYTASILRPLGRVVEWRDSIALHQISHAYLAATHSEPTATALTASEQVEGFELRWASDLDEAITLVKTTPSLQDIEVAFMTKRDATILEAARLGYTANPSHTA